MEEYAISSGNPIPLKELVTVYAKTIGEPLPIKWGGKTYQPHEVMVPWNKCKRLDGWKLKIGLIEGIKKMEKINEL